MNPDIQTIHHTLSLTGTIIGSRSLENINQLSYREAMALPDYSLASGLDNLTSIYEQLRYSSIQHLVTIIETRQIQFKFRFVAGQLLGLLGDPRITQFDPQMITIPEANVELGLRLEDVEKVHTRYKHYGVIKPWIEKETPRHNVHLNAFALSKYCVTNVEYLQFLQDSAYSSLPDSWKFGVFPNDKANHPVYSVDPEDAQAYIEWLNKQTQRHFRLPAEAEWEYAAAGPDGLEFPWGNEYLPDHCNTLESGILQSTPVGLFPNGVSPFGLLDMAGNVEEYVSDTYRPYPGSQLVKDDLSKTRENYRIARGGSHSRFRDLARTRRRHGRYNSDLYVMGFRLAESM